MQPMSGVNQNRYGFTENILKIDPNQDYSSLRSFLENFGKQSNTTTPPPQGIHFKKRTFEQTKAPPHNGIKEIYCEGKVFVIQGRETIERLESAFSFAEMHTFASRTGRFETLNEAKVARAILGAIMEMDPNDLPALKASTRKVLRQVHPDKAGEKKKEQFQFLRNLFTKAKLQ
jgi:hypothetical protein